MAKVLIYFAVVLIIAITIYAYIEKDSREKEAIKQTNQKLILQNPGIYHKYKNQYYLKG